MCCSNAQIIVGRYIDEFIKKHIWVFLLNRYHRQPFLLCMYLVRFCWGFVCLFVLFNMKGDLIPLKFCQS